MYFCFIWPIRPECVCVCVCVFLVFLCLLLFVNLSALTGEIKISISICKSASRSRQITMPAPHHSVFLRAGCPSCRPTNSVKASIQCQSQSATTVAAAAAAAVMWEQVLTVSGGNEPFANIHRHVDRAHQHNVNHSPPRVRRQPLRRTHKVTGGVVDDDRRQLAECVYALGDCVTHRVRVTYVTLHGNHL